MQNDSNWLDGADMAYLDFEVEISAGIGRDYPVAVVRSPAGEAQETMRFPFDELALTSRLKDLQIALLRSGGARRQALSAEEEHVQAFGSDLFNVLLTGEVRSRYDVSGREARQQGKGLRLKLRIQPPELAALPWEFLYDPRQAEYVCLSLATPLIRYVELPQPIQPLLITPPLRILGMIVSPHDLPTLDVERERQRLEAAICDLQAKGLVTLTWLDGQTWYDLQRTLRSGPWHIFHFIGHGGFDQRADEGMIALADENGAAHFLRATELGRLLADHHALRLVLLNACEGARSSDRDLFSSTAAILVRRGIPAVLAMQYEITDRAAIEFTRTFYEALATKLPIDAAVTEARKAISLAVTNSMEWGTPVLYMRAPEGVIFQIASVPDRQMPPAEATKKPNELPKGAKPTRSRWIWLLVLFAIIGLGLFLAKWTNLITLISSTTPPAATPTLPITPVPVPGIDVEPIFYDFSKPAFDGRFNQEEWKIRSGSGGKVVQANGYLTIAQEGVKDSERSTALIARRSISLPLLAPLSFETKILRESAENGGGGISLQTNTALYGCGISRPPSVNVIWWEEDVYGGSHKDIAKVEAELGKWYTCRADFYPGEERIEFSINGRRVESRQAVEIHELKAFILAVSTELGASGTLTFRFDDVRIGPIK